MTQTYPRSQLRHKQSQCDAPEKLDQCVQTHLYSDAGVQTEFETTL